jgi:electron transfer flavoprotein alpha subunit
VAEHNGDTLALSTRHAVTAAKELGGDITFLIAGPKCAGAASEAAQMAGIGKILVAENAAYEGNLPERLTPLLLAAQDQFKFSHILGGSSAFISSLLPTVAAKLDVSPVSDIIGIKVQNRFCVICSGAVQAF